MRLRFGAWLLFFPVVLLLAACSDGRFDLQSITPSPTFDVAPEFQAFYVQFGGSRVIGTPITEAFILEDEGPLLQYFQAARLEYVRDPAIAEAKRIRVYPLGEWALAGLTEMLPATPDADSAAIRHFPETNESVMGDFLAFYETYGGEWLLGPPISGELDRDGRRVQYFRNGRLDWYPELPEGQQVQLAFLGQAHFDSVMAFAYLQSLREQFVPAVNVTSVEVFAFAQQPILYSGDEQMLHVTVLTPEGRSVSGLRLSVRVSHSGGTEEIDLEMTGDQNQVHLPIDATGFDPGQRVEMLVSVFSTLGDVLGTDSVAFNTWW